MADAAAKAERGTGGRVRRRDAAGMAAGAAEGEQPGTGTDDERGAGGDQETDEPSPRFNGGRTRRGARRPAGPKTAAYTAVYLDSSGTRRVAVYHQTKSGESWTHGYGKQDRKKCGVCRTK